LEYAPQKALAEGQHCQERFLAGGILGQKGMVMKDWIVNLIALIGFAAFVKLTLWVSEGRGEMKKERDVK